MLFVQPVKVGLNFHSRVSPDLNFISSFVRYSFIFFFTLNALTPMTTHSARGGVWQVNKVARALTTFRHRLNTNFLFLSWARWVFLVLGLKEARVSFLFKVNPALQTLTKRLTAYSTNVWVGQSSQPACLISLVTNQAKRTPLKVETSLPSMGLQLPISSQGTLWRGLHVHLINPHIQYLCVALIWRIIRNLRQGSWVFMVVELALSSWVCGVCLCFLLSRNWIFIVLLALIESCWLALAVLFGLLSLEYNELACLFWSLAILVLSAVELAVASLSFIWISQLSGRMDTLV